MRRNGAWDQSMRFSSPPPESSHGVKCVYTLLIRLHVQQGHNVQDSLFRTGGWTLAYY